MADRLTPGSLRKNTAGHKAGRAARGVNRKIADHLNMLTQQVYRTERSNEKEVSFRKLIKDVPSTTYATFALYRYPAKFIPQVVAYILKDYGFPGMTVFDPFAGCGTVGIVSKLYGYDYELWDLNPLLDVLHRVATMEVGQVDVDKLLFEMVASRNEFVPQWSNLQYWFAEDFLPFLCRVWGFYHSLDEGWVKDILSIPLLKATRYFSYDDQQRQKLSKSPKSEMRVNALLHSDWKTTFLQMVGKEIQKLFKQIEDYWKLLPERTVGIVKAGVDTLDVDLDEERDILITSPPYLQSHQYIRQAKIDLFWLGYSEEEIRKLSRVEIPYRKLAPQPIYSDTFLWWSDEIRHPHLCEIFKRYFWGVLGALTRLQKNIRSYIFLFVGRPSMRGYPVPIDKIFIEHFTSLGWTHEITLIDTIVSRRLFSYSVNPATGLNDRRTLTENLVIFRR